MAAPKWRATKAQYARLFDNREELADGVEVTLFPNGQKGEIWVQSPDHRYGFRIKLSGKGKAGFGIEVEKFSLGATTDAYVTDADYGETVRPANVRGVNLVQYYPDDRSQTFRKWYRKEGGYPCLVCGQPDETFGQPDGGSRSWCSPSHKEEAIRMQGWEDRI